MWLWSFSVLKRLTLPWPMAKSMGFWHSGAETLGDRSLKLPNSLLRSDGKWLTDLLLDNWKMGEKIPKIVS